MRSQERELLALYLIFIAGALISVGIALFAKWISQ